MFLHIEDIVCVFEAIVFNLTELTQEPDIYLKILTRSCMHVRGNMVHHVVELPLHSDEVTYLDIEDLLCMFEEHVCNLVELLLPSDGYNVIPRISCM